MGVFSKTYLRFWQNDTEDINKLRRIKLNKSVHEITSVAAGRRRTLVVYEDGSCESLESSLESRIDERPHQELVKTPFKIENVQLTNGVFSFLKIYGQDKYLCYSKVDDVTLKSGDSQKSLKLIRSGQNVKLMGCVVIADKPNVRQPSLITIWSDKRLFKQALTLNDTCPNIGTLHSIVDSINANKELSVTPVSEDCIAIYASTQEDDGSFVILYNMKFKIVQSKVPFKVYLSNFKLWCIRRNILLAMGEQLSVIPYRITIDKLSTMVGSQRNSNVYELVEKEMINEDLHFEENLEFDDNQASVEDKEIKMNFLNEQKRSKAPLSKSKPAVGADEVNDLINEIYHEDLTVDTRFSHEISGAVQVKLLSNLDESFPFLSENLELFCHQLESYGNSEIEITSRVIPFLIKTNRIEDIGLLLEMYNHVSENVLTKTIKYLLSCPYQEEESLEAESKDNFETKSPNVNISSSTTRGKHRDVLVTVLGCSFDSHTMLKSLRKEITLSEMIQLMDQLYKMLSASSLYDPLDDLRGNLVESYEFDMDAKLFEWFKLLLDSHYQQILLSHYSKLHKKLELWLQLVDDQIKILTDMNNFRSTLAKISNSNTIQLPKKCNQWYSIERLQLY